jgi:hypothetical protein
LNPPEENQGKVIWALAAALAIILAYKNEKKAFLAGKLIRIRDNSVELNLMLEEKNKHLLEKQDYEIHLATLKERNSKGNP